MTIANDYNQLIKIQRKIMKQIEELPNFGDECNCEELVDTFTHIHQGNIENEYHEYCIKCGGFVCELEWV